MAKKQRKLSADEQKRMAQFEATVQQLTERGYQKNDLTVSTLVANILGIVVIIPVLVLLCWLYVAVNKQSFLFDIDLTPALIAFVLLIVVHECIHGLSWAIFAKGHLRDIRFGFVLASLMPYCTCTTPLTKGQYLFGVLSPTVVVGLLPAAVGIALGSTTVFCVALMLVLSGGGDALIALKLLSHKELAGGGIYIDHPYECGIVAFERVEESSRCLQ